MPIKRILKWVSFTLLIFLGTGACYLTMWPIPIEPVAWTPPTPPALQGPYQTNEVLAQATRINIKDGLGPEGIAVDTAGFLFTGTQEGTIFKISPDGKETHIYANTGGRPGGMSFDKNGNLIVADLLKGLLSIDPKGQVTTLTKTVDGEAIRMANDVDIADDGVIYFSDTSSKYDFTDGVYEMMEHRPHGRLLMYEPVSKKTTKLMDHLYMANGVAVSPDQSFVLVSEMCRFRIQKYWLKGAKKGHAEIIIDNLPGLPDNITAGNNGIFWIAMPAALKTRSDMDMFLPRPFVRKIIARLPRFMAPAPENYAFVLGIDSTGKVVANLQDPEGKTYSAITSVREVEDRLYLGSSVHRAIAWFKVNSYGKKILNN